MFIVVVKMIKMAKLMKTNFDTSELKTRVENNSSPYQIEEVRGTAV
jgi:hypothetical protein